MGWDHSLHTLRSEAPSTSVIFLSHSKPENTCELTRKVSAFQESEVNLTSHIFTKGQNIWQEFCLNKLGELTQGQQRRRLGDGAHRSRTLRDSTLHDAPGRTRWCKCGCRTAGGPAATPAPARVLTRWGFPWMLLLRAVATLARSRRRCVSKDHRKPPKGLGGARTFGDSQPVTVPSRGARPGGCRHTRGPPPLHRARSLAGPRGAPSSPGRRTASCRRGSCDDP